jgi:ubiquinone/menaquinone biosynthesis C-methylase UbiE
MNTIDIQRAYYAETAQKYDDMHEAEHDFAFQFMLAAVEHLGVRSILDIGCGTGRALITLKEKLPHVTAVGIEPSPELRGIGYAKGLSDTQLVDGDGMNLAFSAASFDLVCAFAVLHHIPKPSLAVSEMLRVSRKAIFISDSNNFGQGSRVSRLFKQICNSIRLWPLAHMIKTRGKGYSLSEGDGLFYSYSVFNDYQQVARQCRSVHMLNTANAAANLYRTASHVALLGIKHQAD